MRQLVLLLFGAPMTQALILMVLLQLPLPQTGERLRFEWGGSQEGAMNLEICVRRRRARATAGVTGHTNNGPRPVPSVRVWFNKRKGAIPLGHERAHEGTRWTQLPSQLHFGMLVARQKQYQNSAHTRTHIEDMSDGEKHG